MDAWVWIHVIFETKAYALKQRRLGPEICDNTRIVDTGREAMRQLSDSSWSWCMIEGELQNDCGWLLYDLSTATHGPHPVTTAAGGAISLQPPTA